LADDIQTKARPLYDGRAAYSKVLVDQIKSVTHIKACGDIETAFSMLVDYFMMIPEEQIKTDKRNEIIDEINMANKKRNNYAKMQLDVDCITNDCFNRIFPKIIGATSQLLIPTQMEQTEELNDDTLFG